MDIARGLGLFVLTALAEIVGCYLPWLWLRQGATAWLLLPAAASLALFVWLLTLHPAASGRVYAAYGGMYLATALMWLRVVDGVRLTLTDWVGAGVALLGFMVIVAGWRGCERTRRRLRATAPSLFGNRFGMGKQAFETVHRILPGRMRKWKSNVFTSAIPR